MSKDPTQNIVPHDQQLIHHPNLPHLSTKKNDHLPLSRPAKIIFTGTQSMLRSAKSGSVKQKLNLQNTKLQINIENLSSALNLHKQNENKLKTEVEKYREKLKKYKERVKQKDQIIIKLMEKIQKTTVFQSGLDNLLLKVHQQNLRGYQKKLQTDENVNVRQVLDKYSQLLNGYSAKEQQKRIIQQENLDLKDTIQGLKQKIRTFSSRGKLDFSKKRQSIVENLSPMSILRQEKEKINKIFEKLSNDGVQLDAHTQQKLDELQRIEEQLRETSLKPPSKSQQHDIKNLTDALILKSQQIKSTLLTIAQKNKIDFPDLQRTSNKKIQGQFDGQLLKLRQDIESLKEELSQRQAHIQTMNKNRAQFETQFGAVSSSHKESQQKHNSLVSQIEVLEGLFEQQIKNMAEKTGVLIEQEKPLEDKMAEVHEIDQKLRQFIQKYEKQAEQWSRVESGLLAKVQELSRKNFDMEALLQKQIIKKNLFQLKLKNIDQNYSVGDGDTAELYLEQKFDIITKESLYNKKENQVLRGELARSQQAFDILQKEFNEVQAKLYTYEDQGLIPKSDHSAKKQLSKIEEDNMENSINESFNAQVDLQKIKHEVHKSIDEKGEEYVVDELVKSMQMVQHLKSQINNLRTKNIDLRIKEENMKRQSDQRDGQRDQLIEKIKKQSFKQQKQGHRCERKSEQNEDYQSLGKQSVEKDKQDSIKQIIIDQSSLEQMTRSQILQKCKEFMSKYRYEVDKNEKNSEFRASSTQQRRQEGYSQRQGQISNQQYGQVSQINQQTFKNINDELDRLTSKCEQLEKQKNQLITEYEQKVRDEEGRNKQLMQKILSGEEVNKNLSKVILHLEQQLSNIKRDVDVSAEQQRGSDIIKPEGERQQELNYVLSQRIEEYERLLQLKDTEEGNHFDSRKEIKKLQAEIETIQQQLSQINAKKQGKSKHEGSQGMNQNLKSLTKINGELVRKVKQLEQRIDKKQKSLMDELEKLEKDEIQILGSNPTNAQIMKRNKQLKELMASAKSQLQILGQENRQMMQKAQRLTGLNKQLTKNRHDDEKKILSLKGELYQYKPSKQSHAAREDTNKQLQNIFSQYERKIENLQKVLEEDAEKQVKIQDMYDTINYLNNQCELLSNEKEILLKEIEEGRPERETQIKQYIDTLDNRAKSLDCQNIEHLVQNYESLKKQNQELFYRSQNSTAQYRLLHDKCDEYFKKIDEGLGYEIIQQKDQQINNLQIQIHEKMGQNEAMKRQNIMLVEQNKKIAQQLQIIEERVKNLTEGKGSMSERSKLTTHRTQDVTQVSGGQSLIGRREYPDAQTLISSVGSKQELFSVLREELKEINHHIQSQNQKQKANFDIFPSCTLPEVSDLLIVFRQWLGLVWNMAEDRTNQYNQLREEMNIISLECIRGGPMSQDQIDPNSSAQGSLRTKNLQIIEERYEQVLAELIEYENLNKKLEKQILQLKNQLASYKKQMEDIQSRCLGQLRSESSEEAPYNEQMLNKILSSSSESIIIQKQIPQIIKLFLIRIKELESALEGIEVEVDHKNKKLDSLLQKERSFRSQKSDRQKEGDVSHASDPQRQIMDEQGRYFEEAKNKTKILGQEQSYSLNSVKVFKEIQELTRLNQELKQKILKYKNIIDSLVKCLVGLSQQSQLSVDIQSGIKKIVLKVDEDLAEESKNENLGFDLEFQNILGSGLSQIQKSFGHEDSKNILSSEREPIGHQRKKSVDSNKMLERNIQFLKQNKLFVDDLFARVQTQNSNSKLSIQDFHKLMAQKFTDQEIQEILYVSEPSEAVNKVKTCLYQSNRQKGQKIQKEQSMDMSEGGWVESQQIQGVINKIYPNRTELCQIVFSSINMLMLAETGQGILRAIQFLFVNLKKIENELQDKISKKNEFVIEYGKKMQKLLQSRHSDDSEERTQLVTESAIKEMGEFVSEIQIRRQEDPESSKGHSVQEEDF